MTVTLDLEPELELRLRELAETNGLSVQGYLLTLVEAMAEPAPSARDLGIVSALRDLLSKPKAARAPVAIAADAARQMKTELLAHKERAVEAVTKVNVLRATMERLQALIAKTELQALATAREGRRDQALRCFQESCIYGENLKVTKSEFDKAGEEADALLALFKQEERKVRARESRSRSVTPGAVSSDQNKTSLSGSQMQLRIVAAAGPEEWEERFEAWMQEIAARSAPEGPVLPVKFVEISVAEEDAPETERQFLAWEVQQRPATAEDLQA